MNLRDYLTGVFQSGKHSHFYLFSEEGVALEALYVLFCKTKTGCRECSGCRAIASESENDLFVLRPETGARIKDEQVEEALSHTKVKPVGEYRTVVILDADKMTIRAQNHLLKSLEEAPENVIFLMETPFPESLLPTVVSRAIRIQGKKNRRETTELTRVLLNEEPSQIEKVLKSYKDRRAELTNMLRIAVDEVTRMYLSGVKDFVQAEHLQTEDRICEREELRIPKDCDRLEKLALSIEKVVRNLEQNGNFDLNIDMLIYGRHLG